MARPKEFDREIALERAMDFFWERGYHAASMRDLLAAMQIGRQSLYDTFGDKHSLFLACLEHYHELGMQYIVAKLHAPDGGMRAIEAYFSRMGTEMTQEPYRSCLMINSAIELAPSDPKVAAIVNRFVTSLQQGFVTAIEVAKLAGESRVSDNEAAAWYLTNNALGLGPMSRARVSHSAFQLVAEQLLGAIRA